jgi:V8-like Glu-specific endopeptidase
MLRTSSRLLLSLTALAAAGPSAAQTPLIIDREKVLVQNMEAAPIGPFVSTPGATTGLLWSRTVSAPSAAPSVRIHIVVRRGRPAGDWRITVRDLAGTEVESFVGGSPQVAAGSFWTGEVTGRGAEIELRSDAGADGLEIEVDRYASLVVRSFPMAITGVDQRLRIGRASAEIQGWGKPIARLRFVTTEGQFFCTGFLVTPTLLMTNQHCLSNPDEALSALVDFDYDDFSAQPRPLRVSRLEATSKPLDYSIVRLATTPSPARGIVTLGAAAALEDQPLVIVQHPAGEPKQASIDDCKVAGAARIGVGTDATDFGHLCDTLGGSSGSPVFARQGGAVVGLHHLGFRPDSQTPVNQAVHIARVLDDLAQREPALRAEIAAAHP